MIKGGYILQPRIIQESDISVAPPYVREIWNYLLREANSRDNKYNGHEIKRGQLFRSYEDIREGTKWFVGWRKMTYNENQTKKAMKFLRDTGRIYTTKELGGVMITICKYDYYQDQKNYERTTKDTKERTIEEPLKNQPLPDNNNEVKEINNEDNEEEYKNSFEIFRQYYPGTKRGFEVEFENFRKKHKDWKEVVLSLSDKLNYQRSARELKRLSGGFVPEWKNLSTWINQRCWEEEIETNNISNGNKSQKPNGATNEELSELLVKKYCTSPEQ